MKRKTNRQPMQPIQWAKDGFLRFKENPIVSFMVEELERRGFDLNSLHGAIIEANKHDWDQFNQLIGYSVSNCPLRDELTSYRANDRAEQYTAKYPAEEKKGGAP